MTDVSPPSPVVPAPLVPSPVVLVIGASSGIGRSTALLLAAKGARLVLGGRSKATLEPVAEACRAHGADVSVVEVDVLDGTAVETLVASAVARHGRLDVCVHSVAVVGYGRFEDVPPDVFDRVVQIGVMGTANVARSVLAVFRRQRSGTFIVIGSILGRIVTPYLSPYVTGRAAVHALVRVLAIENRDLSDVNICLLMPGSVDTPVYRRAASFTGRVAKPPPPVISPEKVARAVLKLIERPRPRVDVGPVNKLMAFGFYALPAVYDLLVTPLMNRIGFGKRITPHTGNVFEPTRAGDVDGETYTG